MKRIYLLFIPFVLFFCQRLDAQARYFVKPYKDVVDSAQYEKLKQEEAADFSKAMKKDVTIKETFSEIRRTKDSIILSYSWTYSISPKNTTDFDKELVGKEFPMPLLKSMDGKNISIHDLKGKPSLINFWFTTCAPCIEEMPALNRIKDSFKDQVNFIAITFENEAKAKNFLKANTFEFTHIADAKAFTNALRMESYPVNIFLDKEGVVRRVTNGIPSRYISPGKFKPGDGKEFSEYIGMLLK